MRGHPDVVLYELWLWERNFDRDFRDVLIRGCRRRGFGNYFW